MITIFFNWFKNKFNIIYHLFKFESWARGILANGFLFLIYTTLILGYGIKNKTYNIENIHLTDVEPFYIKIVMLIAAIQFFIPYLFLDLRNS